MCCHYLDIILLNGLTSDFFVQLVANDGYIEFGFVITLLQVFFGFVGFILIKYAVITLYIPNHMQ